MQKRVTKKQREINKFEKLIEEIYEQHPTGCGGSFGELLCWEIHSDPINPRMGVPISTGYCTGLTFRELAKKWGISVTFLGEIIADHCQKLAGYED